MKKISFIVVIIMAALQLQAQIITSLILNSRPSAKPSEWAYKVGTITLVISNQAPQGGGRRVKIKATLRTADGSQISTTDLNRAPIIVLPDGNSTYDAGAVYALELQQFDGSTQKKLNSTGKLSSGAYQLCVDIVEPTTFAPLATTICRTFFIAATQLPICMLPANNQELDATKAQTAIIFRWTPYTPAEQGGTIYRIQVFEILEHQQPVQALRSNQSLLDQNVFAQTQFIWRPQLSFINSDVNDSTSTQQNRKFIWSVQAIDGQGNPIGNDANTEGRSEPKVFIIVNNKTKPLKGWNGVIKN
jgi:hypothetical protein